MATSSSTPPCHIGCTKNGWRARVPRQAPTARGVPCGSIGRFGRRRTRTRSSKPERLRARKPESQLLAACKKGFGLSVFPALRLLSFSPVLPCNNPNESLLAPAYSRHGRSRHRGLRTRRPPVSNCGAFGGVVVRREISGRVRAALRRGGLARDLSPAGPERRLASISSAQVGHAHAQRRRGRVAGFSRRLRSRRTSGP